MTILEVIGAFTLFFVIVLAILVQVGLVKFSMTVDK